MKKVYFFMVLLCLFGCEKVPETPPKSILVGTTLDFSRGLLDGYDAVTDALVEDTQKAGGKVETNKLRKPLPFKEYVIVYQIYKINGKELLVEGDLRLMQTDDYQTPIDMLMNAHFNLREYMAQFGKLYFHGFTYEKTVEGEPVYLMVLSRK